MPAEMSVVRTHEDIRAAVEERSGSGCPRQQRRLCKSDAERDAKFPKKLCTRADRSLAADLHLLGGRIRLEDV
jgi:hypothetical protein